MPAPCSGHACSLLWSCLLPALVMPASCHVTAHMLPFSGECDILQDGSSTTGPLPPPVGIRPHASLPGAQLQLLPTSGVHWGTEEALQLSKSYLLCIYPKFCCYGAHLEFPLREEVVDSEHVPWHIFTFWGF